MQLLNDGSNQLGIGLSVTQQKQLLTHIQLVQRWNRRLNLTAIISPREMVIQHLLDSLSIVSDVQGSRIIDIGSGAGFPGIPFAITLPDQQVTLLDTRGKRVEFMRHASASIGLKNTRAVKSRVENYRPAEKFDTLITRAFSSLSDMLAWTKAMHTPGSRMLAMKGKLPTDEIEQLTPAWQAKLKVKQIQVPFLEAKRHLVIIEF